MQFSQCTSSLKVKRVHSISENEAIFKNCIKQYAGQDGLVSPYLPPACSGPGNKSN